MAKLVLPSATFIHPPEVDEATWVKYQCWMAEYMSRTSRKSQSRMTEDSYKKFLKYWAIEFKPVPHGSILRHATFSFILTMSRSCSHQLVRHGLSVFTQASTRYIDERKNGELEIVLYPWETETDEEVQDALTHADISYAYYEKHKNRKSGRESYRRFLPQGLITEVAMTANMQEWRQVIFARVSDPGAEDEIKYTINLCREKLIKLIPDLFEDLEYKEYKK